MPSTRPPISQCPPGAVPPAQVPEQIAQATEQISRRLMEHAGADGRWTGRLSSSALSTATAVLALALAERTGRSPVNPRRTEQLICSGRDWLRAHQNSDGGWGDTDQSLSNISTTMLAHATLLASGADRGHDDAVTRAQAYIEQAGGVDAVLTRYGRDRTFSIPILTHCALSGTVAWQHVLPLPFELSCLPARFYAAVRLPVVSYALPALIAIGHAVFHHRGHRNPLVRMLRTKSLQPSLRKLGQIQPENGGFLEATPLTSFVAMSLISCGRIDERVTQRCLQFIDASARADGSWPIDTNLSTWVTTLSVNALACGPQPLAEVDPPQRQRLIGWILDQQYTDIHPYTNAAPGGWSWTNLPGAVPDADDTPGAMLALLNLTAPTDDRFPDVARALDAAAAWLLNLQNRDGGWPTFCRGWGTMPFDRSSSDISAHAIRALTAWKRVRRQADRLTRRIQKALDRGYRFLQRTQRADGSWLPLWFGNQHQDNDENPLYGTARVLLAFDERGLRRARPAVAGLQWLLDNQNADGSWGGGRNLPGSVEETGLGLEAVCGFPEGAAAATRAAQWLAGRIASGAAEQPTPIGFYFARLWYYEQLYPLVFAAAGLRRLLASRSR